ncbi:SusC/RagA family TonB-linked outer membrane protein [Marivirga tractuosa]|uniref:TonB-dependent receptor plug n=1 Tax=Marivirga tractuosa (strain ATCC 23168 / DSM 4126 / NBRC 15989 / NCIMB 1408 / VKM B-1430 / H-43) TaxID=643867 RepID=E4TSD9_MARTH|nr:SusC/RagA family TonB-linked outer membrane protein [Marivirga tractuosa]ADR22856.1 TonB-dependent receptor plug [Marivirga tractuosa DSM 4126]BDD16472.1 SusC/RagA family TonB-linked outer membrane protein [Marivirga tractuosa]
MKKILLTCFMLVFVLYAWAQDRTVSGKVTDSESGEGLPGVNVLLKGTGTGVNTDLDGNYKISVPSDGGTLVFTFIGMAKQEIPVGSRSVIDVAMVSDVAQLSEVVVTGSAPGITTKTLGYSIGQVDGDLIQNAPGIDPAQALQGKVAGVRITQAGSPGSNAGIRLRGTTSLFEGQQPLIIVDGMIIDGGLSTINSEDIASVQVLKSASAAALYGSRAANGAIVIKTNRGSSMKKGDSKIVIRNEVGQNFLPGRIPLAETHHYEIDPETGAPPVGGQVPRADGLSVTPYPDPVDYQDILFEDNLFYTNFMSMTGNAESMNYMVSGQHTRQPGIIRDTQGQQRFNFKANLDFDISDKVKVTTSNFYSRSTIDVAPVTPFFDILTLRPDRDLFEEVPNPNNPAETVINAKPDSSQQMVNPVYSLQNRYSTRERDRYIGSIGIDYKPFEWMTLEGFFGLDKDNIIDETVVPFGYLADDVAFARIGAGGMTFDSYETLQTNVRGNILMAKEFGDLSLNGRLGYWWDVNRYNSHGVTGDGFTFGGTPTLSNISDPAPRVRQTVTEVQSESGFAQVGTLWQDKISLDLLGRVDAVSLFGADARTYFNYRVAASYRLTEDVTIPGIQELKIRGSQATSGVQPRFSAQYETYNVSGGTPQKNTVGNSLLQPATSIETEFGVNVYFLDRFDLDVTYVNSTIEDQIIPVPLIAAAGYNFQWQNAGTLTYQGVELSLNANIVKNENFTWNAGLVFDKFIQEITDLPIPEFRRGTGIQQSDVFLIKEGEPVGAIYATKWMRSLDEVLDGNPEADLSDYVINDEGYVVRASQIGTINEVPLPYVDEEGNTNHKVGDTNPDFNLGFNNTFVLFKNFRIYMLWDWKQGGDIYSQTNQFLTRDNRAGYIDQRGAENPKPIGYYQAFYNTNNPSSYFVYDGSFLKLRELSVNYNVPVKNLGWDFINGIQVGIVGRNLFTVSDYPGYDPEVGQGPDNVDRTTYAVDGFRYPNFRTISGSLQLTF